MIKACDHCSFFKPVGSQGECRRYPPSADMGGVFPIVEKLSWCGEFQVISATVEETLKTTLEEYEAAQKKQEEELPHKKIIAEEYLPKRKK